MRKKGVLRKNRWSRSSARADREPVSALAKRHGIGVQTIYTWRASGSGGFQADEVRRLRQLEAENARLKKLVREEMKSDPFCGAVYVFRAKRADRVKPIYWDGTERTGRRHSSLGAAALCSVRRLTGISPLVSLTNHPSR